MNTTDLSQTNSTRASSPALRRISLQQVSLVPLWGLLIIVFGVISPHTFLTMVTFRSVAAEQAITAITAIALIPPLAAGVYDLSIGANMGMSIVLVAWFQWRFHFNPVLAIALTLGAGLVVGISNALVIVFFKVNSFIATLGMMSVLQAAVLWISGDEDIVQGISNGFLKLGTSQIFGISVPFFYMLVLAAICWYVLNYRQSGRYLYATGSNLEAARLAGVRSDRLMAFSLLASAGISSLAGIIFTASIGAGSITAGPGYLLPAFAAVFLGATQSRTGRVNVPGTLVGVYVIATGVQGLELAGAPFWIDQFFDGIALIIAVAIAGRASRRRA
jgi:ribose transport system permease protein